MLGDRKFNRCGLLRLFERGHSRVGGNPVIAEKTPVRLPTELVSVDTGPVHYVSRLALVFALPPS